jgi:hypothetical protein
MSAPMLLRALVAVSPLVAAGAVAPPSAAGVPAAAAIATQILRLDQPVTATFRQARLADAFAWLEAVSNARIQPLWADERHTTGLSPESLVDIRADQTPMIELLQSLLSQVDDAADPATWQLTAGGAIEVGPRSRLNARRTVRVYNVQDLLVAIPDHARGATIDLQSALQSNSQSGSPIHDDGPLDLGTEQRTDRVAELLDLITATVEPEQWERNGGDGAWIRYFQGQFIVNAPGYIHRQLR